MANYILSIGSLNDGEIALLLFLICFYMEALNDLYFLLGLISVVLSVALDRSGCLELGYSRMNPKLDNSEKCDTTIKSLNWKVEMCHFINIWICI